jgi:hypothetical protein
MFNSLMTDKGTPGRPRYQRGDRVRFSFRNRETDEMEYLYGEVWIVDSYGTFFNDSEPSYDVYVVNENWPEGCLFKHIPESRIDTGLLG